MKIDTRLAIISLLVGIGSLIVGIKQCQFAESPVDINKNIKEEEKKSSTERGTARLVYGRNWQ